MLTAALAVLCALLVLVLLVQRPAIWPVLVVLAVLWFALFGVFRYRCCNRGNGPSSARCSSRASAGPAVPEGNF